MQQYRSFRLAAHVVVAGISVLISSSVTQAVVTTPVTILASTTTLGTAPAPGSEPTTAPTTTSAPVLVSGLALAALSAPASTTALASRSAPGSGAAFDAVLALASVTVPLAESVPFAATPSLTLDQVLSRTMAARPALLAVHHEEQAARAMIRHAGRPADPRLFSEWDNFSGTGAFSGNTELTTTVGFSQEIALGGKLRRRRNLARAEWQVAALEARHKRLELRSETVVRFVQAFFLQETVRLEEENLRLLEATATAVGKRVSAGEAIPIQQTRAAVEAATGYAALERLRRELSAARVRLAALWAKPADVSGRLEWTEFHRLPILPGLAEIQAQLAQHPLLQLAQTRVTAAGAAHRVARSETAPELEITAAMHRVREANDRAYMAGVSVSLPIFAGKRDEVRARRESYQAAELQANDAQLSAIERVTEILEQLHGLYSGIAANRQTVLPGAATIFAACERGYRLGELDLLDLLDAQRTLVAAGRSDLEMLREACLLLAEFEYWWPGFLSRTALEQPVAVGK